MITIAICDDNPQEQQELLQHFHIYRETSSTFLQIHTFSNGFSLLDAIDQGTRFDIIILDILMPGENGIDIARELRKLQNDTAIVFLTSTPEYAVESYEVQASNYLLKPVTQEKFFKSMDYLLTQLSQKENAGFIVYNSEKQYVRIAFSQLIYAESTHKTVTLHLADNTKVTSIMTFTEFLHLLEGQPYFIRPHRSYVVNMNYMQYVGKSDICLMNEEKLPLSRNQYKNISKTFLDYACAVSFQQ